MNGQEKRAVKQAHIAFLRDLDAKDVAPFLYQNDMLQCKQYERICESPSGRRKTCQRFLRYITSRESKCTFQLLVDALRHENSYPFLADKLEENVTNLRHSATENISVEYKGNSECQHSDIIYEPVRKINVFTKNRKNISELSHKLKRLSHDGKLDVFRAITDTINNDFLENKLNSLKNAKERMKLADMRFTSLEAGASSKRVKYDKSINGNDVFREMESVIPFTSNPRVSSMTYLARYGSAVAMNDSLDHGLAFLEYAKEHAEYVSPCKDTGMVYYIEVNMLMQKYEQNPVGELKANILKTSELAIAQFCNENEAIKNDYQRMLLLKMVFCYLGIGLFGKKIDGIQSTINDIEDAKKCLDFIETPAIWEGMEKRRKMLFFIAKSEFYRRQNTTELAMIHANEAVRIASENKWTAELPNIEHLIEELKMYERNDIDSSSESVHELVASMLSDIRSESDNQPRNIHDKVNKINHTAAADVIGGATDELQFDAHPVNMDKDTHTAVNDITTLQGDTYQNVKQGIIKFENMLPEQSLAEKSDRGNERTGKHCQSQSPCHHFTRPNLLQSRKRTFSESDLS